MYKPEILTLLGGKGIGNISANEVLVFPSPFWSPFKEYVYVSTLAGF